MPKFYAVVGSITIASRLKKELERKGIRSFIVPTPGTKSGCSYSLLLPESAKKLVLSLSGKYRIKRIIDADGDDLL